MVLRDNKKVRWKIYKQATSSQCNELQNKDSCPWSSIFVTVIQISTYNTIKSAIPNNVDLNIFY